jgi:hypothetical protein
MPEDPTVFVLVLGPAAILALIGLVTWLLKQKMK